MEHCDFGYSRDGGVVNLIRTDVNLIRTAKKDVKSWPLGQFFYGTVSQISSHTPASGATLTSYHVRTDDLSQPQFCLVEAVTDRALSKERPEHPEHHARPGPCAEAGRGPCKGHHALRRRTRRHVSPQRRLSRWGARRARSALPVVSPPPGNSSASC